MSDLDRTDTNSLGVEREPPGHLHSANGSRGREPAGDPVKGVVTNALEAIAQSGSADQLRGYTNAALGETKLSLGLAVGSPELALLGIAQKALGQAQTYIGKAKMAEGAEAPGAERPPS